VPNAKALVERIRRTNAAADSKGEVHLTHAVISAPWISGKEIGAMAQEFPEIVFVVVSHSNVGFLSADPSAIHILREVVDMQMMYHNVYVGGNSHKFTDWASEAWGVNAICLPNLYSTENIFPHHHQNWRGGPLRIGLFGANRPLKNRLTGAAAAVELSARLRVPVELVITNGRNEGGNNKALEELTNGVPSFSICYTGWLAWPEFRRLLRSIDLVMQVSYTESFNVVAADAVAEGIPVVVSDAIDWLPHHWRAHADEPRDVTRVAESLLRDPNTAREGLRALERYVERGVEAWRRFLVAPLDS